MNESKKISVIVPVYKVEKYLARCLDSILGQTHKDLEVILVDDGSPDNSGSICDEYAKKDARVRVIHKPNGGVSSARNAGIDIAEGDFLTFVDSDDTIEEDMYAHMLRVANETESDIVECNYREIVTDEEKKNSPPDTDEVFLYTNKEMLRNILVSADKDKGKVTVIVCDKLFKRELFDGIRFCEECIMAEDNEITTRMSYRAKRIAKVEHVYYNYYQNEGSCINSPYTVKKCRSEIVFNLRAIDFFKENEEKEFYEFMVMHAVHILRSHYFKCYQRKKDPVFKKECKYIVEKSKELYPLIKGNPNAGPMWRYTLFRVCPPLWYLLSKHMGENGKLNK